MLETIEAKEQRERQAAFDALMQRFLSKPTTGRDVKMKPARAPRRRLPAAPVATSQLALPAAPVAPVAPAVPVVPVYSDDPHLNKLLTFMHAHNLIGASRRKVRMAINDDAKKSRHALNTNTQELLSAIPKLPAAFRSKKKGGRSKTHDIAPHTLAAIRAEWEAERSRIRGLGDVSEREQLDDIRVPNSWWIEISEKYSEHLDGCGWEKVQKLVHRLKPRTD
jgi:hypothetical protein